MAVSAVRSFCPTKGCLLASWHTTSFGVRAQGQLERWFESLSLPALPGQHWPLRPSRPTWSSAPQLQTNLRNCFCVINNQVNVPDILESEYRCETMKWSNCVQAFISLLFGNTRCYNSVTPTVNHYRLNYTSYQWGGAWSVLYNLHFRLQVLLISIEV